MTCPVVIDLTGDAAEIEEFEKCKKMFMAIPTGAGSSQSEVDEQEIRLNMAKLRNSLGSFSKQNDDHLIRMEKSHRCRAMIMMMTDQICSLPLSG